MPVACCLLPVACCLLAGERVINIERQEAEYVSEAIGRFSAVLSAGATRQEVAEMIGVAMLMGGGPSAVYGVEAMRAYDEFAF
ncbi:carboxymuconolactone decarboxylase family protein [Neptunomonas antarctica]|uniref:Carboxymuconolactone decarboxylase family protein n=1 Tax=Neptunomonas antarctica TaxID=619304 RepID=A0A1N7IYJ4_9GAMM|nr:hypothetical protein [Neptunomonas antarctica]SIS42061.1 hypothetical protein SAMN05421760_101320 [Neptunomonas antarctica]